MDTGCPACVSVTPIDTVPLRVPFYVWRCAGLSQSSQRKHRRNGGAGYYQYAHGR